MARRKRRNRRRKYHVFEGVQRAKLPPVLIAPVEWMAIRVSPIREHWLRRNVFSRARDVEVYRPEMAFNKARHGRKIQFIRSAAPGYLFVGGASWRLVMGTLYRLTRWLDVNADDQTIAEVFGPIQWQALQTFSDRLTHVGLEDIPDLPFLPNQRVVVDEGSLAGNPGVVEGMPDSEHVRVNVLMFKRQVTVTLAPSQLRAA